MCRLFHKNRTTESFIAGRVAMPCLLTLKRAALYWTWRAVLFLCLHFRYALAPHPVVQHLFSAAIVRTIKQTITTGNAATAANAVTVAAGSAHAQSFYPALRTYFAVYAQTNWLPMSTTRSQRSCSLSCSGSNRFGCRSVIHATRC